MAFLSGRQLLIQALASAAFGLVVIWRIDVVEAVGRLRTVNLWWVAVGIVFLTLSNLVQGYRWHFLLSHGRGLPLRETLLLYLVSRMANVLLPFRGGDVVRVQVARARFRVSRTETTATVFGVETALNWATLLLLLGAVLVVVRPPFLPTPLIITVGALLATACIGLTVVAHTHPSPRLAARWPLRLLPDSLRCRLVHTVRRFVDGLVVLREPRSAATAVSMSLLIWATEVGVFWSWGQAFDLDVAPAAYVPIMLGPQLVRTVPLTPGDLGTYEVVVTETTAFLGVAFASAASYAVGTHLLILVWQGLLGMLAMWTMRLHLRDLLGRAAGARPHT